MYRHTCYLVLLFAVGCGSSTPPNGPNSSSTTEPVVQSGSGIPSTAEASACITDYFAGLGLSNLEVVSLSSPVETPKDVVAGWAYSVTLKCDTFDGERLTHNNWLVVLENVSGKAKVRNHFDAMSKLAESPLGKEWFASAGLPMPLGD